MGPRTAENVRSRGVRVGAAGDPGAFVDAADVLPAASEAEDKSPELFELSELFELFPVKPVGLL